MIEQDSLTYPVLSDTGLVVARLFGLAFELPAQLDSVYTARGLDLKAYYGAEKSELPISATYVIDQDGSIVYAYLEADYKLRAEPVDILEVLSDLTATE